MRLIDSNTVRSLLRLFKLPAEITAPIAANGEWLMELETTIFDALREVGRHIVEAIVNALLLNHAWRVARLAEVYLRDAGQWRPHSTRSVNVDTLFGSIALVDVGYWVHNRRHKPGRHRLTRGKAGGGRYPLLEHLGIFRRATPGLIDEVARQATLCSSFDEARQNLAARGLEMSEKTIESITYALADRGLAHRTRVAEGTQASHDPQLFNARRVRFGIDGGRCKIRYPNMAGRRTRKGRRGFSVAWREPRLILVEVLDDKGERDENIPPMYITSLGDADTVMELLEGMLRAYGIEDASEIIVCADGALWFWERLPDLYAALSLDRTVIVEVLDAYQALSHLWSIAEMGRFVSKRALQIWYTKQKQRLFRGHWRAFLSALDQLKIKYGSKNAFETERAFFVGHRERLSYAAFKRRAIPRGSGAIESAIRQVINLRVKSSGKHWREEHAEGMLFLRGQLKSGRWRSFMSALLLDFDLSHAANLDKEVSNDFREMAA